MLTATGRRARSAVTVSIVALTLLGTFVGDDDDFPFGPFKMYAGRDDPNGLVPDTRVEAVDSSGRLRVVDERSTGLRRAEIEGQAERFRAQPELLAALATAHARLRPDEPRLVEIRVVERLFRLQDSRPTGEQREQVLARWQAS